MPRQPLEPTGFIVQLPPRAIEELTQLINTALSELRGLRSLVIQSSTQRKEVEERRLLSPSRVCKRYVIGRRQLLRKIETGELPAVRRDRCRGGRAGLLLRLSDVERVLALPENINQPPISGQE